MRHLFRFPIYQYSCVLLVVSMHSHPLNPWAFFLFLNFLCVDPSARTVYGMQKKEGTPALLRSIFSKKKMLFRTVARLLQYWFYLIRLDLTFTGTPFGYKRSLLVILSLFSALTTVLSVSQYLVLKVVVYNCKYKSTASEGLPGTGLLAGDLFWSICFCVLYVRALLKVSTLHTFFCLLKARSTNLRVHSYS